MDAQNKQMKCIGGWNDPDNCKMFRSALTCVHENAHGRKGEHQEACAACKECFDKKEFGGCEHRRVCWVPQM